MQKHLEMIQNLVDKIEENVSYDVNIVSLANTFDLSPWHFQRLFKSIVGDSLGSYTRGRRLALAATMLQTTNFSIVDIAFEVGFNTHESFTRSFKEYFKYTPKNFRKENPKVILNEKPLLTDELLDHITNGIHQKPVIINRPEQIIIGFEVEIPSPFIPRAKICELVSDYWFALFDKEKDILNRKIHTYYGLTISPSGDFTEDTLRYIAGVPVSYLSKVPDGMTSYTLPKQKVAIFEIKTDINAELTKKTIDYIYGYWLPNSSYKRGTGDDYELFENVIDFRTGDFLSKYVIPLSSDSK